MTGPQDGQAPQAPGRGLMALDENEMEMKRLAEHFLAQPNQGLEMIDLCKKVLILIAKRKGKPATPPPATTPWRKGYLYLESETGKIGPHVACRFIVHGPTSVEIADQLRLIPNAEQSGVVQRVVLEDATTGQIIIRAYMAVMTVGQTAVFQPGPLVRVHRSTK